MRCARSMRRLLVQSLIVLACGSGPAARAQAPAFQHRWGGFFADSFLLEDGSDLLAWACGDQRILHRVNAHSWSYQRVPDSVKGTIRRVFFLPRTPGGALHGFAVSQDGKLLESFDGGAIWSDVATIVDPATGEPADLQDVHFIDEQRGWLVSLHTIWFTIDGGGEWIEDTTVFLPPLPPGALQEYYAIDVIQRPSGALVGLVAGEPGLVLRAEDPQGEHLVGWTTVMDVREMCTGGPLAPAGTLTGCELDYICGAGGMPYEPWDLEMSRNPDQDLALVVGGMGAQCGLIFSSNDGGLTWRKDLHVNLPSPPPVHCDGMPLPEIPSAWCRLKSIYGVGIFDADNTAVAAGYNGQQLRRNPAGEWEDRSVFLSPFLPMQQGAEQEQGVVFPLFGVDADSGGGTTGRALLTGMGGYLRASSDGGRSWDTCPDVQGTSWRLRDLVFTTTQRGVLVGQHGRVARSTDAGRTWEQMSPGPAAGKSFLNAVAVAAGGSSGIAVGDPMTHPGASSPLPVVLHSSDATSFSVPWSAASVPQSAGERALHDVAWGGSLAWCAGQGGLILRSADGGASWSLIDPSVQDRALASFDISGLAFLDSTTVSGVFVGQRPLGGPKGPVRGALFRYLESGSSVPWKEVTPSGPGAAELFHVAAVAVGGSTAWAVGDRIGSSGLVESGIILRSSHTGDGFGEFLEVPGIAPLPCTLGKDIAGNPILSAVAVAHNGDVIVGGQCGFIATKRAGSSVWIELPSRTTSHVRSISTVPTGPGTYAIFVGAIRHTEEMQCIVVYD